MRFRAEFQTGGHLRTGDKLRAATVAYFHQFFKNIYYICFSFLFIYSLSKLLFLYAITDYALSKLFFFEVTLPDKTGNCKTNIHIYPLKGLLPEIFVNRLYLGPRLTP